MNILITGITGAHARLVAHRLQHLGHQVIGIDRRPWSNAPPEILVYQADIRKRPAEEVFRQHRPEVVVHMATITHFTASREERLRINLHGTRAVFAHCHSYGVKQAIFVGRHTIYGAAPDAPLYRSEEEPPLAASTYPELADLVAADLSATTALWRWPAMKTAVLRLVYTLGPSHRGTLANFLEGPRVPMVMGFDPLFHFMHDEDAAEAIVQTIVHQLSGVFNVVGPPPLPLSLLCKATERRAVWIPEPLLPHVLGHFGFPFLPRGSINHLKYPIVVDGSPFHRATNFRYRFEVDEIAYSFRASEST